MTTIKSKLTLKELLLKAIEKEITAQKLYHDLEKIVTGEFAREVFRDLGHEEEGHQRLLERYLRGELKRGALRAEQVIDYKITESSEPTEIYPNMPLKDIYLRAASREKAAYEAYLALAAAHPAGGVKTLLEDLASQELTHKHKLEYLYNEVAFPQTAGG